MLHRLVGWLRAEGRQGLSRRQWARWIGQNWARVSHGRSVELTWLEVNRLEIALPDLSQRFAGFRIAQLSDFHGGPHMPESYLGRAVELALAEAPDLIVLTGDFIHGGFKHVDAVADVLGRLRAPCGVFAVLGNHDYSVRNALGIRRHRHLHHAVADALALRGIRVLRNQTVALRRQDACLYLTGVEDLWSRACDLERAFADLHGSVPRVVLAHNPRTIERLDGRRCDLMLSGHTHGGQVDWPGLGRLTLGHRMRRCAAGLYRYNDSFLYVNKGIGHGFRFRFGVRPEVAVTTLRPAAK